MLFRSGGELGLGGGDARGGLAVVELEQGIPGADVLGDLDVDAGDERWPGGGDLHVFTGGLDEAGGRDLAREWRTRRGGDGAGVSRAGGLAPDKEDGGGDAKEREIEGGFAKHGESEG